MTRTAIRLSAVLAVLAAAVAQWVSPGAGAAPEWAVPQRRVTVTYWDSVDPARNALMANTVIPAYMRLHSEVAKEFTIKYEVVPDLQSKLLAALDAPEPAADLVMVPDWYLPNLYQARVLDPLPTTAWDQHSVIAVAHTYVPQTLAAQMDGGRLYAVPVREHALSLFINNRMFRAAGLDPVRDAPKTWRDVAKLNTRLTKEQGGRTVEKGFEMRDAGCGDRWPADLFQMLLYQAGGEGTTGGLPVFNNDAGVRALTEWRTVTVDPQATHNTAGSPYQDFATEQDAMTVGEPTAGAAVEAINPKMAGNYTVVPLPQMSPDRPADIFSSDNWAVSARSPEDRRIVAWDFVHFAAAQPRLFWTAAGHLQPVRWYDPLGVHQLPYLGVFVHDLSVARPRARSTRYPELQAALARMIARVFLDNADPKQALDQAANEYAAAFK